MRTMTGRKAQPNEHGALWADSRTGKISIACAPATTSAGLWRVWALYKGTHDIAPGSRNFTGPNAERFARDYANELWARS